MKGHMSANNGEMSFKSNGQIQNEPILRKKDTAIIAFQLNAKYLNDVPIMAALRGRQTAAVKVFTLYILPVITTFQIFSL